MIEAKLQLLSILSNHTADRNFREYQNMSVEHVEELEKLSHTKEYTDMFYLVANDVMNTLYASEADLESTGDPMADLEAACEDAGVNFTEVQRHGATYLNILKDTGKMESDTHTKLSKLLTKALNPAPGDE